MSGEHFLKRFHLFLKISKQHSENAQTLQRYLPSIVPRAMSSFDTKQRSQFNILSVGSGGGEMDIEITNIILQEFQSKPEWNGVNISNQAIEPNEYLHQCYKKNIAQLDNPRISFDVKLQTFEEYKESKAEKGSFDIVHFIHSLYHVDVQDTLVHCMTNELNEKGHFVALLTSTDQSITLKIIMMLEQNCPSWMTKLPGLKEKQELSTQLIKIAEQHGWKYEIYKPSSIVTLDVTEVFDEESVDGNLLLDFLTNTEDFRKKADESLQKCVLELAEEMTFVKDGKRLAEIHESLLFIYK